MRTCLYILMLLVVSSCKQSEESISAEMNLEPSISIDKATFYENYLRDRYKDSLESDELKRDNFIAIDSFKNKSGSGTYTYQYFKSIELALKVKESNNPDKHYYDYKVHFYDEVKDSAFIQQGIWAVTERKELIQGEQINRIKINWNPKTHNNNEL